MMLAGIGRMLGRLGGQRKLDPSEQRYQDAQPFESIRQELMAQGVPATPQLMQSYQDQAASQKATGSGGAMGKRSFTGAGGPAASLALKGGPMAKRSRSGGADNTMLQQLGVTDPTQRLNLMSGGGNRNRTLAMFQGRNASLGAMGKRTGPPPEMPGGSFYQQTLSGGAPPGASFLSKAALANPYQWNRTAREGTKSYQSPF